MSQKAQSEHHFCKESGSVGDGKESSMGCAHSLSPTAQESSETGMTTRSEARLLCRQLGREVRNAALSITDTSSCSRETPCLRGLISILMSCSEAQLGLPTPAGHSHSFTCNYHQTQGAPFPHPQPPPEPGLAQTFRGCSSTQC